MFGLLTMERVRRITALAVPIVLGMVSQNLLNLIDTAFVGHLGDSALAAVGMGGFVNWLLVAALIGLGSGVQATAARRMGEGKEGETAVGLNAALIVAACAGIPMAILGMQFSEEIFGLLNDDPQVQRQGAEYLSARFIAVPFVAANFAFRGFWNGTNRPMNYMSTLVVMHAINIILDYGLIFGRLGLPEMGVAGAGYATSIALVCGTSMYVVLGLVQGRANGFMRARGVKEALPVVLRLSVPAGLQQVMFSAGFVIFFVIAGKIGTDVLAASNVIINLILVSTLPAVGLGLAGASLVGQSLGAGDIAEARRWGWSVAIIGSGVMGLLGLIQALGARTWLGIFLPDSPATLELAVVPLIIIGLYQAFDGIGVVLLNILIGVGDTVAALKINTLAQWVLFLPLAWIFAVELGFGMMALWIGMGAYRLLIAVLVSVRFRSGAWALAQA